jgi:HNH endonuclease
LKPQRRLPEHIYKDYKQYKKWLREDFRYRCAYCFIHENEYGGYWHFHVDHYRPKSREEFKHLATEYSNLLYSCDQCNNLKSDIWPSDNPLEDGVGWLDPCEHDLQGHYYFGYQEETFTIICLTQVGRWMVTVLALDQPARINHHRELAEKELLDAQSLEALKILLKKTVREYQVQPTNEKSTELDEIRQLLQKYESYINSKHTPKPFTHLKRSKYLDIPNTTESANEIHLHLTQVDRNVVNQKQLLVSTSEQKYTTTPAEKHDENHQLRSKGRLKPKDS